MPETRTVKKLGACEVTFGTRELGYTAGGVEFVHNIEYADTEVDQLSMPIDSEVDKSTVTVKVPLVAYTKEDLVAMLYGAQLVTDSVDEEKTAVDVYDATGAKISSKAAVLKLVPKSGVMDDYLTVFKAAPKIENVNRKYTKGEMSVFEVTFLALPESNTSDRLYRFGDPDVTAAE